MSDIFQLNVKTKECFINFTLGQPSRGKFSLCLLLLLLVLLLVLLLQLSHKTLLEHATNACLVVVVSINLSIVANETCTKRQLDNKSISTAIVLLQSEMWTGEGGGEGGGGMIPVWRCKQDKLKRRLGVKLRFLLNILNALREL